MTAARQLTVLEYAMAALNAGLCVLPPEENGSKKPIVPWKSFQDRRPDAESVRRWYANDRSGLGVVCGSTSGNLEVFDFDDRTAYERFKVRANKSGLAELVERIEAGYLEETPKNGIHWLYRCSSISGNMKLARRYKEPHEQDGPDDKIQGLIETRGEGGYIVTAPSYGRVHKSGNPYRLLRGGFDHIVTLEPGERESLLALARTMDRIPGKSFVSPVPVNAARGDRPGDDFNARSSWAEVLAPHGWAVVWSDGGETFWKRPGSDNKWSATTNYQGSDLLYVFSTATAFEPERSYDKFAAYAILNHGGDFSAAARDLSEQGYGEQSTHLTATAAEPGINGSAGTAADESAEPTDDADPYRFVTLADLLAQVDPEVEPILDGLLWERTIHWIFSEVNAGKTFLMMAWALCVSSGTAFCGRATKQMPVLFIEEDSSKTKAKTYLRDLCYFLNINPEDCQMVFNDQSGMRIMSKKDLDRAKQSVLKVFPGSGVVFMDAAESIAPSGSYTSSEMEWFQKFINWVVDELKSAPVVSDHMRKATYEKGKKVHEDPMDRLYGGLTKRRLSDFAIKLDGTLGNGSVTCEFVKARGEFPDSVEIRFSNESGFSIVEHPPEVKTETERQILKWLNNHKPADWHTGPEIIEGAGVAERTGFRALAAMAKRRLLEAMEGESQERRPPTLYRVAMATGAVFS